LDPASLAGSFVGIGAGNRSRRHSRQFFESSRRQLSIPHRVLDIFVTKVRLQRLGIVASVGQRIAAGVEVVRQVLPRYPPRRLGTVIF